MSRQGTVFMAGASSRGFSGSQARKKELARLSHSPRAIWTSRELLKEFFSFKSLKRNAKKIKEI